MKKNFIVLLFAVVLFGCLGEAPVTPSAEKEQTRQTEQALQEMNSQVGMPSITNFQEKRLAKMIFELRDRTDLVTYAYIVNLNGDLIYIGECIGYGLPYSVQYTNPEKMGSVAGGEYQAKNPYTIPQADPNGLYMPDGLSATWLIMRDPSSGEVKPVYVEPEIIVSPFKLK